jgi:glycosyltransferase involved in cell wall biosynthesis
MTTPLVSVCVPAFRAGRHLGAALRSLLGQTLHELEIVVVDNGSDDDTAAVAASFSDPRLRIVRNPRVLSIDASWNRAVRLCTAPLVKLVCADDLLHPDCLRVQHAIMAARPEVVITACRRDFVDAAGRTLSSGRGLRGLTGTHDRVGLARAVVRHGGNPIGEPAAVLLRRAAFEAAGGFDPHLPHTMDLRLWLRMLAHGHFHGSPRSLAAFRVHGASRSATARREQGRQQRRCTAEIAAEPGHRVRQVDRVIGGASAPLATARRLALFRLADHRGGAA